MLNPVYLTYWFYLKEILFIDKKLIHTSLNNGFLSAIQNLQTKGFTIYFFEADQLPAAID